MKRISPTTIKFNTRLLNRGYVCTFLGSPKRPACYDSVDVYNRHTLEFCGNYPTPRKAYNFIFRTQS